MLGHKGEELGTVGSRESISHIARNSETMFKLFMLPFLSSFVNVA